MGLIAYPKKQGERISDSFARLKYSHPRVGSLPEMVLDKLVQDKFFTDDGPRTGVTQLVEVILGRLDAPTRVLNVAKAIEEFKEIHKH